MAALAEIPFCLLRVCFFVVVSYVFGASDSVSPLGVIPGDIAKERRLYRRPTEPPPAFNKDIHTFNALFLSALEQGSCKRVHRIVIRRNSSSLSKSSNVKKSSHTSVKCPPGEGDREIR